MKQVKDRPEIQRRSKAYVSESCDFETSRLDLSSMVGHRVKLYSQQFHGKELSSKVLSVTNNQILAESGTRYDNIDNLVNNQTVVIQLPYRGQEVSVKALYKRTKGGRCCFQLDDKVTPLVRRRFRRFKVARSVRLAACSINGLTSRAIESLCWMETNTIDVSSGGALVEVPTLLAVKLYLLMNIDMDSAYFPPLVLARVRYCQQLDNLQFRVGAEFIVKEMIEKNPALSRLCGLLATAHNYRSSDREQLNKELIFAQTKNNETLK